jgi:hypothetical protein
MHRLSSAVADDGGGTALWYSSSYPQLDPVLKMVIALVLNGEKVPLARYEFVEPNGLLHLDTKEP